MKLNQKVVPVVVLSLVGALWAAACKAPVLTSPSATVSPSSTVSPAPAATITRVPSTQTEIPTPTLTPLPTLSPAKAQEFVLELLENNGGCRLPCWWGLAPGQTDWLSALRFLQTFATKIRTTNLGAGVFFEFQNINGGALFVQEYRVEGGVVSMIHPQIVNGAYGLSEMLSIYGRPTDVQIRTFATTSENYLPFRVVLIYDNDGILIEYEEPAKMEGNKLRACPQQASNRPQLWVWSPGNNAIFAEVAQSAFGTGEEKFYRSLAEVTDLTVDEFYQVFKDSANTTCLDTTAALW